MQQFADKNRYPVLFAMQLYPCFSSALFPNDSFLISLGDNDSSLSEPPTNATQQVLSPGTVLTGNAESHHPGQPRCLCFPILGSSTYSSVLHTNANLVISFFSVAQGLHLTCTSRLSGKGGKELFRASTPLSSFGCAALHRASSRRSFKDTAL